MIIILVCIGQRGALRRSGGRNDEFLSSPRSSPQPYPKLQGEVGRNQDLLVKIDMTYGIRVREAILPPHFEIIAGIS